MTSVITCCNDIFFEKAVKCLNSSFEHNKEIDHIIYLFGNKPDDISAPEHIQIKKIPENIENLNKPFLFAYKYWAIIDSMQESENVIYTDSANKITGSLSNIEKFYHKDALLLRYMDGQFLIKNWTTKKCIYDLYGENLINIPQIWAGFQSYKKTEKNIDFLKKILNLCLDESISGPSPSIQRPEADNQDCFFHRNDQSILSIESIKNDIYPPFDHIIDQRFGDFISVKTFYPNEYTGDIINQANRKVIPRHYKTHNT